MSTDIPASGDGADARTAPVQGYPKRIPWEVHLKAFEGYSREYGSSQSAERLAARGGFGVGEMDLFYPKWREHVEELPRLRVSLATRDAEIAALRAALLPAIAAASVCGDIQMIMKTYREQEAEGSVDTPGGLEHMGDVWRLLEEWDERLTAIKEGPVDVAI